jgi:hypothetical protein
MLTFNDNDDTDARGFSLRQSHPRCIRDDLAAIPAGTPTEIAMQSLTRHEHPTRIAREGDQSSGLGVEANRRGQTQTEPQSENQC